MGAGNPKHRILGSCETDPTSAADKYNPVLSLCCSGQNKSAQEPQRNGGEAGRRIEKKQKKKERLQEMEVKKKYTQSELKALKSEIP